MQRSRSRIQKKKKTPQGQPDLYNYISNPRTLDFPGTNHVYMLCLGIPLLHLLVTQPPKKVATKKKKRKEIKTNMLNL